jgi:xylulokinase
VARVSAKGATIGIDIGTTAVKAVAADEDGRVVARVRIPHQLRVPAPDRLEHDADEAWRRGPLTALAELGVPDAAAVAVTAMVPSLTAVDDDGRPLTPGLLYGDVRGRSAAGPSTSFLSGEAVEFLRWTASKAPHAHGYWPATAVANHALAGEAVVDTSTAATAYPLFDGAGWSETVCADCDVTSEAMPRVQPTGAAVGRVREIDAVLAAGAVDAVCEQIVAGADHDGDVLVLCGTTLIVWVTLGEFREVPGLWTLPHPASGRLPAHADVAITGQGGAGRSRAARGSRSAMTTRDTTRSPRAASPPADTTVSREAAPGMAGTERAQAASWAAVVDRPKT